ncbi:glycosyltransferase [Candidatus Gottesmanbacteria bacterium]|nr:glycosyltransferase [Candidatus Gottesmanbacteria bacterium]
MSEKDVKNAGSTISVVIPAYNEEKNISVCLDSLVKQSTTRKFEVIVVNNNSSDNTVKIANEYNDKLNLRIIQENQKGRGAARRAGFSVAKGSIILSTDTDASVPANWIEKIMSAFEEEKEVSAITGTCKFTECSFFTNAVLNLFQPFSMRVYNIFFGHYWLSGFNFALRRATYLEAGGFDSEFYSQEDVDLSFKVNKIGRIKFISDLCVIESGRRFQKGLIRGVFPYIKTFISYFWFKRKDIYLDDQR